ncbi:MAG: class I SAM-dependent methyltransferase [Taibaiella sp.]|nr:class I SAM-dependent methyltransferase [Taibaiella sp.]
MNKNVLRFKKAVHSFLKEMKSDPYKLPYMGDNYHCPVCKTNLAYFKPIDFELLEMADKYQSVYPMFSFETINMFKYSCPRCYASDRDRMYALYIEKRLGNTPAGTKYNLLDIAPSELKVLLKTLPYINYRSADLNNPRADDKVDITDMNIYENSRFDIFVCSHVLEHVKDDIKAMKELHRVLKPGGWGIAMVPINTSIEETFEDDNIVTDGDRWKYYGQDDHVRMYSKKGFINNLQQAGFKVNLFGVDYFGAAQFERHGIHARSVLYIVEKI